MGRKPIRQLTDLEVYNLAYSLAADIFELSKKFPKEELYSLTDQIKRSSRSVSGNISEGFGKRKNGNTFKQYLYNALGSVEETKTWLDYARDYKFISQEEAQKLKSDYVRTGAMLYRLIQNWHSIP